MKTKNFIRILQQLSLCAILFCFFLNTNSVHANDILTITGARVVGDNKSTRFIADVSKSIPYKISLLSNPYRVVIDIPQVGFEIAENRPSNGRGLVSDYRYGLFSPGKSRIVLDVLNPVQVNESILIPPIEGQPARLVVNLIGTSREEFSEGIVDSTFRPEIATKHEETFNNQRDISESNINNLPVIVIDPGHGGIDNGTKGVNGILEKNVVLDFAKILQTKISSGEEYYAYLTRADDRFLTLSERVEFARERDADLFISLHADSVPQSEVRGATVYTLSEQASDSLTAQLAIKENQSDLIAGVDLNDNSTEVTEILFDLAKRESINFSRKYSQFLVKKLASVAIETSKNPHRSGGFQVLSTPGIPSVLLELGYLSNEKDRELLTSLQWLERSADAVIASLNLYFQSKLAEN